jgi:hypothetical protein
MVKFPDTSGYLTKDNKGNFLLNNVLNALSEGGAFSKHLRENPAHNPPRLNNQKQPGISPDASLVFSLQEIFFLYFQLVN